MSASEKIRYWADFVVKNLPALLTIFSLLGFSVYKTVDSIDKDTAIEAMDVKITELAEKDYMKTAPKTKFSPCNCKAVMNRHLKDYHQ